MTFTTEDQGRVAIIGEESSQDGASYYSTRFIRIFINDAPNWDVIAKATMSKAYQKMTGTEDCPQPRVSY